MNPVFRKVYAPPRFTVVLPSFQRCGIFGVYYLLALAIAHRIQNTLIVIMIIVSIFMMCMHRSNFLTSIFSISSSRKGLDMVMGLLGRNQVNHVQAFS